MRKSKKRVIAIITCCFVLATFCVGVFADETTQEDINPAMDRVGTITTIAPYDLGSLSFDFDNISIDSGNVVLSGYYIVKITINNIVTDGTYLSFVRYTAGSYYDYSAFSNSSQTTSLACKFENSEEPVYCEFNEPGTYYCYCYYGSNFSVYKQPNYEDNVSIKIYSIANRSVIDSVYSNSQDVHNSLVSVINEATNVITTNDVVMMFCILIPVISFGVGILIRLRKRS